MDTQKTESIFLRQAIKSIVNNDKFEFHLNDEILMEELNSYKFEKFEINGFQCNVTILKMKDFYKHDLTVKTENGKVIPLVDGQWIVIADMTHYINGGVYLSDKVAITGIETAQEMKLVSENFLNFFTRRITG